LNMVLAHLGREVVLIALDRKGEFKICRFLSLSVYSSPAI